MTTPGLPARRAAAAVIAGVLANRRSLSDQAGAGGPLERLAPAERARAQALAAGVLRHLGRIDALLGRFLDRPPPAPALNALRLAVAEVHLDGIPPHAAVDAAVRLAAADPKARRLKGLVNAVGRRVAEAGPAAWAAMPEAGLPAWIAAPVAAAWGEGVLAAVTAASRSPAPLDLTLRDPAEAALWAARLGAERLPTGSLRLAGRAQVSALPGFAEGAWWVQDAAAALPARLLGEVRGREVLDVCAAPGGKSLQLSAAGAAVTALDVSEPRLERLRANLARTGLSAELVVADALAWTPGRCWEAVLLDAPCTASGTLRRHPDLPFLRGARDLAPLVALQARLMARAWDWVAPGGRLVFATCSLLPEEGEAQAARFLGEHPEARQLAPEPEALGIEPAWIDAAGGLRLRPDHWAERGGMDGFYATVLEKRAEET